MRCRVSICSHTALAYQLQLVLYTTSLALGFVNTKGGMVVGPRHPSSACSSVQCSSLAPLWYACTCTDACIRCARIYSLHRFV